MAEKKTIAELQQMKRDGQKIVGVVVWDYHMTSIAERAGVDILSVGDSVGMNLWGHSSPLDVTMEQMLTVAQAVHEGRSAAVMSCDLPYGPLQQGTDAVVAAGRRMMDEAGADMVKLDDAADHPEAVRAMTDAGVPVWAQFGITPHTAEKYGVEFGALAESTVTADMTQRLVDEARRLEEAGAVMLDFTNSGPVVGPAVTAAVSIPVIGGFGGGPWLDGRVRMLHAAIGYGVKHLDVEIDTYANVARTALAAVNELCADIRAGRQIRGGIGRK
ncbi:MAG TPA: 3-methyl-2-oxobutanoate hydroxymethyltransferase [Gammaproteobacteria bacterium]